MPKMVSPQKLVTTLEKKIQALDCLMIHGAAVNGAVVQVVPISFRLVMYFFCFENEVRADKSCN